MKRESAFTLTELLVVVAVLATLAAILLPVFAQVRESARQAACISNMQQIGLAMRLYMEEYDEVLPPVWSRSNFASSPYLPWTELLQPYLKNGNVLCCPSFDERVLEENAALPTCDGPGSRSWFPARHYWAHFGLAGGYTGGSCTADQPRSRDAGNNYGSAEGMSLQQVARPTETAVIQDNFTARMANGLFLNGFGCEGGFRGAGQSRHHQGCNYLFLDGHAERLTLDPRHEPTIACPGATIPGTSEAVADCLCTRYTTFDY